jgi:FAD/FMN-containing dehydrogenase
MHGENNRRPAGEMIAPDDAGYDAARKVFNGMIDRRPALIVRCVSAADVAWSIRTARERGLTLSVYGGGHAVTGAAVCDSGLVVDLRGMKQIAVDPLAQTVRAEGGVTWGELDAATAAHGLVMTGGRNPTTGIGGLTLGSGSGWLERKFGLVCDHLFKAEMVTADGREVVASDDTNPDLFWAIRGGGGNFGIVTAFHFRLHRLGPALLAGALFYAQEQAAEAARQYRDFMQAAPDEICGAMSFVALPSASFVPEPYRGRPGLCIIAAYAGPLEEAVGALGPLRRFGAPLVDLIRPMAYTELQALTEGGFPAGARYYWSADSFHQLPDAAIDMLVAHTAARQSPIGSTIVIPGGGAAARVNDDATAFGQRSAPWNAHYLTAWQEAADDASGVSYTKSLAQAMKPWTTGRVYLNYVGNEGDARIEASFGARKMARLRKLKAKWDPDNVFCHNHNIQPAIPPTAP